MSKDILAAMAWVVNLVVMFLGLLGGVSIDLFYWFCFGYSLLVALVASIKLPPRQRKR